MTSLSSDFFFFEMLAEAAFLGKNGDFPIASIFGAGGHFSVFLLYLDLAYMSLQ
jgi:hypothetical protein